MMGNLLKISKPQSPYLKSGDSKYLQGLFGTMSQDLKIQILNIYKSALTVESVKW